MVWIKGAVSRVPPPFLSGGKSLSQKQAKCARKGKSYVRKHKRKGKKAGGFCRRLPDARRAEFKRLAKLSRLGGGGIGDLLGAFF